MGDDEAEVGSSQMLGTTLALTLSDFGEVKYLDTIKYGKSWGSPDDVPLVQNVNKTWPIGTELGPRPGERPASPIARENIRRILIIIYNNKGGWLHDR